jgi:hypothetical protein
MKQSKNEDIINAAAETLANLILTQIKNSVTKKGKKDIKN